MSLQHHSAPGPAAAYAFQFERALYWLASSPAGFVIGIETEDDVAIRHSDGTLTLEQDKHSVQVDAMPFGDRSKDLWNTLSIWVTALETGELQPTNTKFLLVTNKALPNCIAKLISNAKEVVDIIACVEALKQAALNPSETIRVHTETVLCASSEKYLKTIIENCELLDESNSASGTSLREKTIAQLQIPYGFTGDAESITNELLGWLSKQVLALWRERVPAWINRNDFVNQLHAILDRRKRQRTRERAANLIPIVDEDLGQEKGRIFVKQIYLVTDEDWHAEESIRHFIRCRIEKNRLSADGNITDQDWIDFDEKLKARWKTIFSRVKRLYLDNTQEDLGFRILSETVDEHKEHLAGVATEQVYLTAGTYHRMADALDVGWHPDYDKLMKEAAKK